MPIFEYTCTSCRHDFETLVLGSQKPECPECGSRKLKKKLSAFAVSAGSKESGGLPPGCATCGDPRGPGACALN